MAGWIALDTTGLKETIAGLEKGERLDVGKDLKAEFEAIVNDAMARARGNASTRGQRRAAATMKQASSAAGAALRFGAGFRGAFGHEYGAHQNVLRNDGSGSYYGYRQFLPWKGSGQDAGYFMWPGIRKASEEGVEALADAVTKILTK